MLQTVRITSKRQITIPVKIFNELGMSQGDNLVVEKRGDFITLTPAETLVRRMAGIIKTSKKLTNVELEKLIYKSKIKYFKNKYKK